MSRTWFTSDTHFGHNNIIRYSNRPFKDVDHMNAEIVRMWNEVVMPEDTVYHLGDVALGRIDDSLACVGRLNGYKILVDDGNHDRPFMSRKNLEKELYWRARYSEVFQRLIVPGVIDLAGEGVNVSHYPYDGDGEHSRVDRYAENRLPDRGRVLIHGHTHAEYEKMGDNARVSKSKNGTLMIHVGMDAWGYRPVPEEEILRLIKEYTSQ